MAAGIPGHRLSACGSTFDIKPRSNQVADGNDRVAMLLIVVLAQEDRARVRDHFHLCLRDAATVTRNPEAHAQAGLVSPHYLGGVIRATEVVPEDSHGQSFQRLMPDPFLITVGHSGIGHASVVAT